MERGQHFTSRSKIQETPIEYIFNGRLPNGRIHLVAASGDPVEDIDVFPEWFDNREIKVIERRDLTHKGRLRRLEEKTIFNCTKCHPRLCSCENRHQHGVHKDD